MVGEAGGRAAAEAATPCFVHRDVFPPLQSLGFRFPTARCSKRLAGETSPGMGPARALGHRRVPAARCREICRENSDHHRLR